jgi:hypothetical protein
VDPLGRLPAERLVEHHVLGRRREPLLGANHVGDLHQVVVDHVGQVIGRKAVRLEQNLIVDLRVVELHLAAQPIDEHRLARAGHGHAHHERLAGRRPPLPLLARAPAAEPVVADEQPLAPLLVTNGLQPLGRAEAAIRAAAGHELGDLGGVDLRPLRLTVGAERTADVGPLVPLQAHPVERAQDRRL